MNETKFNPGDRVQAHPATETFMMGDRYGTVVGQRAPNKHGTNTRFVKVRMDRSNKVRTFHPNNLLPVQ